MLCYIIVVLFCIDVRCDVRSFFVSGKTAAEMGFKDVIITGDTAVHKAAENGHTEAVKLLFFLQADIEIKNKMGSTPLHRAVSMGRLSTVEFLLSKGAKVDAMNNAGNTALHCACYTGNAAISSLLLEAGGYRITDRTNRAGMTPVDYARKPPVKEALNTSRVAHGLPPLDDHDKKPLHEITTPAAAPVSTTADRGLNSLSGSQRNLFNSTHSLSLQPSAQTITTTEEEKETPAVIHINTSLQPDSGFVMVARTPSSQRKKSRISQLLQMSV